MTHHTARDHNYAVCKPVAGVETIRFGAVSWLLAAAVAIVLTVLVCLGRIDPRRDACYGQASRDGRTTTREQSMIPHESTRELHRPR